MKSNKHHQKSPWLAGLLSLVPGLGQIYNEQIIKGILIFFLLLGSFVLMVIIRTPMFLHPAYWFPFFPFSIGDYHNGLFHYEHGIGRFTPIIWLFIVVPIIYIYAITDAVVSAKNINLGIIPPGETPRQHPPSSREATMNHTNAQDALRQSTQAAMGNTPNHTSEEESKLKKKRKISGLTAKLFLGAVLIFVGLASILNELDIHVLTYHTWEVIWPLIPLLLGLKMLKDYLRDLDQGQFILGLGFTAIGTIFVCENWNIFPLWSEVIIEYWQVVLIIVGLVLIVQDFHEKRRRTRTN